ncbi:RsmD family RNA methyltransferase [Candidatus Saccharibacteria bacterium]|nr:RsmD family RNA methyltransferase [Candidatus Saccharibacteria bacterium]
MRIISGKYKNRELQSPNSKTTHPMGDRERLAIFNMLTSRLGTSDLTGKTVLDLFAGTGALGIEALSRGAISATFVEKDFKALECLKQNLKNIENCQIIKQDANKFVPDQKIDLIFIDPPYDKYPDNVFDFKKYLNPGGILIISSPAPLDETSKKYANCYITLV